MSPLALILVVILILVLLGGGYGYRSGNNVLADYDGLSRSAVVSSPIGCRKWQEKGLFRNRVCN